LYIIMEFLEGKNLNQTVRGEGPFPMERALPILIAVCGALDEAHKAGIIHRDLKPENIFLVQSSVQRDYPKVLDFGLAKVGERQMRPGSVILTQEGMVFGTPEFMSPEQAQGKALTPASDIYSLAVILYEVLTGKLPFDAKSAMDYIQLHVTGKPYPLSQRVPGRTFPPLLGQIMDRALAKRSEDRYVSAADFAQAMQHVLQGAQYLPPHLSAPTSSEMPTTPFSHAPIAVPGQGMPSQPQGMQQQQMMQRPAAGASPPGTMPSARDKPGTPQPSPHPPVRRQGANVGLLVGVALGFLLLGVGIAVALMKFVVQ
ncbi:MAG TPA: serine/threonine-protein kinase, partial [Polyangiaceae bacterium]